MNPSVPDNQKKSQAVTIFDVAEKAGVAISTVSLVLRNINRGYSQQTAQKILAASNALGYKPNVSASSLSGKKISTIALFSMIDRESLVAFDTFLGIQERLIGTDYTLHLNKWNYWKGKLTDNKKTLDDIIIRHFVGGAIFQGQRFDKATMKFLRDSQFPAVVTEYFSPYADSITIDNVNGGKLAGQHLIDRGARNVAVIAGWSAPYMNDRVAGCQKALKEAGLPLRGKFFFSSYYRHHEEGYGLAKKILALRPRVDGIFSAAGDIVAVGAIQYLKEQGIKVPENIRVVGYDDIREADYFDPPLTTVHQPAFEIGVKAADLLIEALEGKRKKLEHVVYEPKLIIRKSS